MIKYLEILIKSIDLENYELVKDICLCGAFIMLFFSLIVYWGMNVKEAEDYINKNTGSKYEVENIQVSWKKWEGYEENKK